MSQEVMHEEDSLNNYFNVLNVDLTKNVIVTEGQLDSLFIFNCIATTGVSKSKLLLENLLTKGNAKIFFDNDLAGKRQSIELIKKGYSVFLWSKFISDLAKTYPDNRLKLKMIKDINDAYSILASIDDKTDLELFNKLINRYFSESELDIILI
jgi:DNA primase